MTSERTVVLIHGLWMNRHIMLGLGAMLARRGHRGVRWGYASMKRSLDDNAGELRRFIERIERADRNHRVDIVAHSYGGVVTLRMLEHASAPRVGRVVLLGSPIAGSRAGVETMRIAGGRHVLGHTASVWEAFAERSVLAVPRNVEVGSLAGTRPLGLGQLILTLPVPNDGVVCVDETKLPGLADHLEMPVSHSTMLASAAVARQVDAFLRHGRFQH